MNRKRRSVWSCAENRSTSRFSVNWLFPAHSWEVGWEGTRRNISGVVGEREKQLDISSSVCDRLKFLFFVFHLKINASVWKRVVLHRVSTLCSRLPGASSRGFLSVCRQALWRWWFPSPLGLCACSLVWAERVVLQDPNTKWPQDTRLTTCLSCHP